MRKVCVQDIENISSCSFCLYPVVPTILGKVIKYEAKKMMSNIYLETLNIEWGQIDLIHNRRVKCILSDSICCALFMYCTMWPQSGHCCKRALCSVNFSLNKQ